MDTPTLLKSAYEFFWTLVAEKRVTLPGRYLPYEHPVESKDLIYSHQEDEFTRELLNSINQFSNRLHQLALWEEVLSNYDEKQVIELRFEFTNLLLYYCLHQPYEFKSRLIFAATQLCYTHGIDKNILSKGDVSKDGEINYDSLDKIVKNWHTGDALLGAISKLDDKKFHKGTKNYRNRTQHRIPPGIDYGYTNVIRRTFSPECRVEYSFGKAPPLETSNLIPLLIAESSLMISAFEAYRRLVDEHTKSRETS